MSEIAPFFERTVSCTFEMFAHHSLQQFWPWSFVLWHHPWKAVHRETVHRDAVHWETMHRNTMHRDHAIKGFLVPTFLGLLWLEFSFPVRESTFVLERASTGAHPMLAQSSLVLAYLTLACAFAKTQARERSRGRTVSPSILLRVLLAIWLRILLSIWLWISTICGLAEVHRWRRTSTPPTLKRWPRAIGRALGCAGHLKLMLSVGIIATSSKGTVPSLAEISAQGCLPSIQHFQQIKRKLYTSTRYTVH